MYQRNGKWYSDFWYEGNRYMKSWGKINKSIAKEKERKFRNEIASGEFERKGKRVEFESFVIRYLQMKKVTTKPRVYKYYIDTLKPLVRFFLSKKLVVTKGKKRDEFEFIKLKSGGGKKIKYLLEIHPFMVQKFKHARKKEINKCTGKEITGCSVNKNLKCLNNMFNVAKKWKLVKENPAKEIDYFKEKPEFDPVVLAEEDEKKFFAEIGKNSKAHHMKAIALLAINTGMRKREILDLEKHRVDFKRQFISLIDTKNSETRKIPLTPELTRALKEAIDKYPGDSPYVFPSPRTGKPYSEVRRSFGTAMKKIGFPKYRFHWLRHTFASRMTEAGIDAPTIMEIGGWKTDSMIKRYSHPSMEHKRNAIKKIQKGVPLILPLGDEPEHQSNLTTTLTSDTIKII